VSVAFLLAKTELMKSLANSRKALFACEDKLGTTVGVLEGKFTGSVGSICQCTSQAGCN